jgi:GABA(A) receptor-associated protein
VEKAPKSDAPDIDKKKYLVPAEISVGKFVYEIRKHMKLNPEQVFEILLKELTFSGNLSLRE